MIRYAITDRLLFPGDERERQAHLVAQALRLGREGVDFLQFREKDLDGTSLIGLASALLSTLRSINAHTRLLINANTRVALSIGANGVHLTSTATETPKEVAELYRNAGLPTPFVSLSCHTLEEVHRARTLQPSAILFGPVFGKTVQGQQILPAAGLEALAAACRAASPIPVLALGGVTRSNAPQSLEAGANGIAAIRMFLSPEQ